MIAVPLSEVVKCHLSFMINVTTFFLLSDAKPSRHLFGTEMSEILPFVRSPSSVISLYEKANVLITCTNNTDRQIDRRKVAYGKESHLSKSLFEI